MGATAPLVVPAGAASQTEVAEARRLGRILYGDDPSWRPMLDFNKVSLPRLITRFTGLTDDNPETVVQGWAASFFNALHDILDKAGSGLSIEDVRDQQNDLFKQYANLAVGIRPDMDI